MRKKTIRPPRAAPVQVFARVLRALREQVAEAAPAGRKMPGVRALALQHQTSTITVMGALRVLQAEGWVEIRPRSGIFPKNPARDTKV